MAQLGEEVGEPFEVPITVEPLTTTEPGISVPDFEPQRETVPATPERERELVPA